jgi:hypothetical protein
MFSKRPARSWLMPFALALLASFGAAGCGDPSEPQSSSSSNWLRCSWTYGRFEASIRAPEGTGTALAFWLSPQNPGQDQTVCSSATDCTTG